MAGFRARCVIAVFAFAFSASACGGAARSAPDDGPRPADASEAAPDRDSTERLEEIYRARTDSARMHFSEADVRFMRGMIVHHAQAILMARLAPERTETRSIRTLAARIINAQQDEMAIMQQWLRDRDQPVPEVEIEGTELTVTGSPHPAHAPGMLTDEQIAALESARGFEFDRLFLHHMIQHHRGAVTMVDQLFAQDGAARGPMVFQLASDIHVDQNTEIARMESMLAALPPGDGAP